MSGPERLYRVDEVAALLSVRPSTVRSWILGRRIGYVKLGRRAVRIGENVLRELIETGRIAPRRDRQG